MTSPHAALGQLCACLAGRPPEDVDWVAVIKLANTALITPQLAAALHQAPDLPDDVRAFLADVRGRNTERNRRLLAQLTEMVGALNRAGIEPTLLKGAALWADGAGLTPHDRLLTDLDLLVRPDQVERAMAALDLLGFAVLSRQEGDAVHAVAELGRPQDVGTLDLHQRPPGPPGLAQIEDFAERCRTVAWNGVHARVPNPAVSVFLTILHDQFHDGDYWRGGFDLRHLADIARLARGVDWSEFEELCAGGLTRNAAGEELLAAARLMNARVPRRLVDRRMVRLQHDRCMAQFRWPRLRVVLAALGVLMELPNLVTHRAQNRLGRRRVLNEARYAMPAGDRLDRLRQILGGPQIGKI